MKRTKAEPRPPSVNGQWQPWEPVLLNLGEVEPRPVEWVFPPWLPRGTISGLFGDGGSGKTWVALALAAAVTTGGPWPTPEGLRAVEGALDRPGRVLLLNGEDDPEQVLKPRLLRLGADSSRVALLAGRRFQPAQPTGVEHPVQPVTLEDDLLESVVASVEPDLVVIDPISAFLPPNTDANRLEDVRRLLSRLNALARKSRCAVLLLSHFGKSVKERHVYRALGSVDWVNAPRSVMMAVADPKDPARRALHHVKHNLSPKAAPLGYAVRFSGPNDVGLFEWTGGTDLSLNEAFTPDRRGVSALDKAMQVLQQVLADGPKPSQEVERLCRQHGVSRRTLFRAKDRLGIITRRTGWREWEWRLP